MTSPLVKKAANVVIKESLIAAGIKSKTGNWNVDITPNRNLPNHYDMDVSRLDAEARPMLASILSAAFRNQEGFYIEPLSKTAVGQIRVRCARDLSEEIAGMTRCENGNYYLESEGLNYMRRVGRNVSPHPYFPKPACAEDQHLEPAFSARQNLASALYSSDGRAIYFHVETTPNLDTTIIRLFPPADKNRAMLDHALQEIGFRSVHDEYVPLNEIHLKGNVAERLAKMNSMQGEIATGAELRRLQQAIDAQRDGGKTLAKNWQEFLAANKHSSNENIDAQKR